MADHDSKLTDEVTSSENHGDVPTGQAWLRCSLSIVKHKLYGPNNHSPEDARHLVESLKTRWDYWAIHSIGINVPYISRYGLF